MKPTSMKMYAFWGIVVVGVVLVIGYLVWSPGPVASPEENGAPNLPIATPTSTPADSTTTERTPAAPPRAAAPKPVIISYGRFSGIGHASWGGVTVLRRGTAYTAEFASDFFVASSSNLAVYFKRSDRQFPDVNLGALKSNEGAQVYEVPAGIDPKRYDRIEIVDTGASVPFAEARLTISS